MKPAPPVTDKLDILRDLMTGGRHSRRTVCRYGVSLPTADRWLQALREKIPGVASTRVGTTTWFDWSPHLARARFHPPPSRKP